MAMHHKSTGRSCLKSIKIGPLIRSLLLDAGGDDVEMVEVGEVENLQIQPLGAGVLPALHGRRRLVAGAGDARSAQLVRLAADGRRATVELALVGADDDRRVRPRT